MSTEERPIDYDRDVLIDHEKSCCRYVRFNGRYFDNNLELDETISVMIPAAPESTNILQFQLVLL